MNRFHARGVVSGEVMLTAHRGAAQPIQMAPSQRKPPDRGLRTQAAPPAIVPTPAACAEVRQVFASLTAAGAARPYALLAAADALWQHHPDADDAAVQEAVLDILADGRSGPRG